MSKQTTSVVVTFQHDEGQDPSKWKFPKSMIGPGSKVADIVSVKKLEEPSLDNAHQSIVRPIVTLDMGGSTVSCQQDNAEAIEEFLSDLFGTKSELLLQKFDGAVKAGVRVIDVTYEVVEQGSGEVTKYDMAYGFVGTGVPEPEPVNAGISPSTKPVDGNIIVRLSGGSVDEVAYPRNYGGPQVAIFDYDAGLGIKPKGNAVPSGYGKDPIGVYQIKPFPVE